jgi:hypothetical protein
VLDLILLKRGIYCNNQGMEPWRAGSVNIEGQDKSALRVKDRQREYLGKSEIVHVWVAEMDVDIMLG